MKNTNNKLVLGVVLALLVIAGGAYFAMNSKTETVAVAETSTAPAAGDDVAVTNDAPATETPASATAYNVPSDPLGERSMGDPKAPVRIEEFASLSCSHCAAFHKNILPEIKSKYIDTGKVFFVFTDFPLNAPALDGSMISRCMPPERYFPFLSMLFETQDQWAFSPDYQKNLRQNSKLAGMSDETFDKCIADTKLKEGIVARLQTKQTEHGINSTPSFVINDKTVLTGALPIAAFDQAISDATKGTAAPTTTEPAGKE